MTCFFDLVNGTLFGVFYELYWFEAAYDPLERVVYPFVKDMIFILNLNPTSLSFYESWSFNMVSELSLAGGPGFESPLCNLFPIC